MPSMNGHFIENMTGKVISFDVQPYERGTGRIVKMTPRIIKTREHIPGRGTCLVEYEVFDIAVEVSEGRSVGALYGGVPLATTVRDTAGKTTHISGCSYGDIYHAVENGRTVVQARCG